MPPHFGCDKREQITEVFDLQDRYMIIFQYTKDDFAKLNTDPTAAKLYDNSGF